MKENWVVDPKAKAINVMTSGEAGFETSSACRKQEVLRSSLFAGLSISLLEVF